MLFNINLFRWLVLPIIVSLILIVLSIRLSFKRNKNYQLLYTVLINGLSGYASIILGMILFNGAWPSYLPYLMIIVSITLFFFQLLS